MINKLVLIGNGFDLAHGLKTSYKNFLDWYFCFALKEMCKTGSYRDKLLFIRARHNSQQFSIPEVKTLEDVVSFIQSYGNYIYPIDYQSVFFNRLVDKLQTQSWVNIEHYYFSRLKGIFRGTGTPNQKHDEAVLLNQEMDFLITQLIIYIEEVNNTLNNCNQLPIQKNCLGNLFGIPEAANKKVLYVNFNYTDTLTQLDYAPEDKIIHIHGRSARLSENPIIFGYGDESDPTYQEIEDIGDNIYLDHIKSFGYFQTNNYENLSSFLEVGPYEVSIIGLSCGLSDRVLLREIFEHHNCLRIDIYYHESINGKNNYKEITQEISRHFRPNNKAIMRHKVKNFDPNKKIPQIQVPKN